MMKTLRLMFRGEQEFDFPRMWRWMLPASALLMAVSIGSFFIQGLELGIEFEGGTSWEVLAPDASVADTRDALSGTDAAAGKIQVLGGDTVRVRADLDTAEAIDAVTAVLAELAGADTTDVSVTTVGPSWGDEITNQARNALIWFFVIIAVYIAVRREWPLWVGALVAVVHDIVLSVGFYSVFGFEVTPATVIAFLTIMGYSLYDTIVVYDRVRELEGRLTATGRYTYTEMMNAGLNQVLMRSINTSFTSVLPVLSMLLVGSVFLGALTLQEFAIALLVGIVVGAYSSVSVASAVVAFLKEREEGHRAVARKVEARGLTGGATRSVDRAEVVHSVAPARPSAPIPTADRPRPTGTAPPRPRKKKKKR